MLLNLFQVLYANVANTKAKTTAGKMEITNTHSCYDH